MSTQNTTNAHGEPDGRHGASARRPTQSPQATPRVTQNASRQLRLALAQIDATVGDLEGNAAHILVTAEQAYARGATVVCYPELALTGYPPEDLLLKPGFVADNLRALERLAEASAAWPGLTLVVGFVDRDTDLYNAAALLRGGARKGTYHKHYLPTYGVFDEDRYFQPGALAPTFLIDGVVVGVNICEDIWYPSGPPTLQAYAGAEVLLNLSSSPFHVGKQAARERMLATRAADSGAIVAYVNIVGGQDELVFDGSSVVFDGQGELLARARAFAEDLLLVDLDVDEVFRTRLHDPRRRKYYPEHHQDVGERAAPPIVISTAPTRPESREGRAQRHHVVSALETTPPRLGHSGRIEPPLGREEEAYRALVLGTRDYVRKNGVAGVVIALSGGIDSALTAVIAVDALGAEHVTGVSMPSRYSSAGSHEDACALADNLGIRFLTLSIEGIFAAALGTLAEPLAEAPASSRELAQENLQARIRGNLLMALTNASGSIVLTTGNKSEMAVGYATLYGDMAGGFAVLKDVFKTFVYDLARWRNVQSASPLIPESTLTKPPSAELRPDQKDTDSLPPYAVLDPILRAYVEEDWTYEEIVRRGFDPATVRRVMRLVDHSEYKRRQAPPGIKITERAFGRDRRLPITNAYHGQPVPEAAAREQEASRHAQAHTGAAQEPRIPSATADV
jgi:NAD+ synthase (glutamine-hydrolysing)